MHLHGWLPWAQMSPLGWLWDPVVLFPSPTPHEVSVTSRLWFMGKFETLAFKSNF